MASIEGMALVLIIEDNLDIRENAIEMLELAGYEVNGAENGKQGLELAREKLPDVILCDIDMPEMDGYEVFTRLKGQPITKDIPFVYFTASVEPSEINKGLTMGAAAYIPKPFGEKELLEAVAGCASDK